MGKKKANVDEDDANVDVNDLAVTTYANIARLTRMGYITPDRARWVLGILPLERKDKLMGSTSWKQNMRVMDVDSTDTLMVHRSLYDSERWRWVCHNGMADGWVSLHDLQYATRLGNTAFPDSASSSERARCAHKPPASSATHGQRVRRRAPHQDTRADSLPDAMDHLRHQPVEPTHIEDRFKDPPSSDEYPKNVAPYYHSSLYHSYPEGGFDETSTGRRGETDVTQKYLDRQSHAQQIRDSGSHLRKRTRFEHDERAVNDGPPRSRRKRIKSGMDNTETDAAQGLLRLKS